LGRGHAIVVALRRARQHLAVRVDGAVAIVDGDEEARHAATEYQLHLGPTRLGDLERLVDDVLRLPAIARRRRAPRQRQRRRRIRRIEIDRAPVRAPRPRRVARRLGDAPEIIVVARQLLRRRRVARRGRELDQPLARAMRLAVTPEQVQLLRQAEVRVAMLAVFFDQLLERDRRARRIHGAVAEDLGQAIARRRLRRLRLGAPDERLEHHRRRVEPPQPLVQRHQRVDDLVLVGRQPQRLQVDLLGRLDLELALAQRSLRHEHARQRAARVTLAIELLELAERSDEVVRLGRLLAEPDEELERVAVVGPDLERHHQRLRRRAQIAGLLGHHRALATELRALDRIALARDLLREDDRDRQRALELAAREVELEQRAVRRQALAVDGERRLVILDGAILVAELVAVDLPDVREHAGALFVLGPQLGFELERLDDARPIFLAQVQIAQAVDGRQARRRGLDGRVVIADRVVFLAELRLHDGAALEVQDRLLRAVVDDADLPPRDLDQLGPTLGAFVQTAERLDRLFVR